MILIFDRSAVRNRILRVVGILVCIAGLMLSNSASAIVALVLAVVLISFAQAAPAWRTPLFSIVGAITLGISLLLPYVDIGSFAGLLGRTATLTGRTDFWEVAPSYILERPWFGYGYGGFFDRDPYSRVWDLWSRAEYFFTPNFHNSALDVTLLLGCVGLAAYVAILAGALSVFRNRTLGRTADILACILILLTASSATDFQFMRHNCLATVLMFYAFLVAGRRYPR
nr:O-antigen ligase family protein [Variibacter gotjawalensis]